MFCNHLSAHYWLNWVDAGVIDDEEFDFKEKPEEKDISKRLIKMRPEAPVVWAKDSIPNFAIIRNCRFGNGQGGWSLWRALGGDENHTQGHHPT